MDKMKLQKIGKITLDVVTYFFLALCIVTVVFTVTSKRSPDGASEMFGYQFRIVTSDSMAACEFTDVSKFEIKDLPLRSMLFVQTMPENKAEHDDWYRSLKVGDVLTFRYVYVNQVTITHRITSITEKETGGFIIELAGDNTTSESGQLYQTIDTSIPNNTNYVIGKVTGQAKLLGTLMTFLMEPLGIILLIILPCAVIIMFEALKIYKVLTEEKRKRAKEESDEKDSELEELRRKLAELEALKAQAPAEPTSASPPENNEEEV